MAKQKLHFQVMNLGHALNHFFILIFPTIVLALQKEWGTGYGELLKFGSFGVLAYGLGAMPSGWLGDRWNQRGMMNVFFYGMGFSAILTSFAQTPSQLAVGVVAIGLFASIYHPVGLALVFSTSEKTGRAIAVNGVAGNIGLACAAVVSAFLAQTFGWQAAFLIPGIVCVLTGVVYSWVSGYIKPVAGHRKKQTSQSLDKSDMIKLFAGIAVIACLGGLVFQSVTTALPKMLATALDTSLGWIGMLSTIIFVIAASVQIIIGELLDRIAARTLLFVVTFAQALFLLLASMVSGWWLVPVLLALVFSTFAQIPINDWLIGNFAADKWRSRIFAMKYTLSLSVGTIAYWLIATVYDNTGAFTVLYLILAAAMTVSMMAAWMMPGNKPQQEAYA